MVTVSCFRAQVCSHSLSGFWQFLVILNPLYPYFQKRSVKPLPRRGAYELASLFTGWKKDSVYVQIICHRIWKQTDMYGLLYDDSSELIFF